MTKIREKKLRVLMKKIIHCCSKYRRYYNKPQTAPKAAQLPHFRVTLVEPFCVTEVDFTGPMTYKAQRDNLQKCYIALFMCTSQRAVFFLTAIWLTHGQLWAILKGTASLTRC